MSATSLSTASSTAVSTWNIDPAHSAAEFKVKHMMISNVRGKFTGLNGALTLDEAEPAHSAVQASIPVDSLSTGDPQRDAHLKSPDFFEAEKFPSLDFRSLAVHPAGDAYEVVGELTLHGVTKTVTFAVEDLSQPAKDPWGNSRIGLTATTTINRKDFGLTWNSALETGGVLVGEDVHITLDVQFIKAASAI